MQLTVFKPATPAHVKAAITHNLLLRRFNIHRMHRLIENGSKIKWVYLRENPLKIESVAFWGDETDAKQIVDFVREYIDYDRIFKTEFSEKLQDFYTAMRWGSIPTNVNQKAAEFFAF
jgi:DNA replicative helicase MCM subunit Mcm2 (Cdc46/Mcm family)